MQIKMIPILIATKLALGGFILLTPTLSEKFLRRHKEKKVEIWSFIKIGIQWKYHIHYCITWPLYQSLPLIFLLGKRLM